MDHKSASRNVTPVSTWADAYGAETQVLDVEVRARGDTPARPGRPPRAPRRTTVPGAATDDPLTETPERALNR